MSGQSLAMAFDVIVRDNASATFGKVGRAAGEAGKSVQQAADAMKRAASIEADAVGKVRVAQTRLDDVRKSGKATATSLVRAEEQLAAAERQQVRAQGDAVRAAGEHEKALKSLGQRTHQTGVLGKALSAGLAGGLGFAAAAAGALAAGAGLQAFTGVMRESIAEARESQQVGSASTAIIKATGGAAKISASQLGDLTTAISNKTGVDDEAIQKGSNLLLTFRNIRNEAGKGNDVFNQATAAALDLSKAGFGSISSASKGLGKALNDPVNGITALGKAGITFTDQQKDQIKALVKSGDVLDAQKIILGEVKKEVGGVAAASTTAGEKLKTAWDNSKEAIGTAFLPALDKAEGALRTKLLPVITKDIVPALPAIADGLSTAIGVAVSFGQIAGGAFKPFVHALGGSKGLVKTVVDYLNTHQADLTKFFVKGAGAAITFGKGIAILAAGALRSASLMLGGFSVLSAATTAFFKNTIDQGYAAFGWIPGVGDKLKTASAALDSFGTGISDGLKSAADAAGGFADGIDGTVIPALDAAKDGLKAFGSNAIDAAGLRDQAKRVALAIDGIGTKADGSQVHLKKFSDISKLSAGVQKALKDRIKGSQDALRDQLGAMQSAGAGQKKLSAAWKTGRDRLYDEFKQMGLSKTEAGKLADKYAGIKPKVKTNFYTPGLASGLSDAKQFKEFLDGLDHRTVKVAVQATSANLGYDISARANGGVWNGPRIRAAMGTVLPGWSPGVDIHKFYSPTGGQLDLSGGEAIMRPEFTRAVGGAAGVGRLNRAAEAGKLDWMPKTVIRPQRGFAAPQQSQAQTLERLTAVLEKGGQGSRTVQHVENQHIGSNVDMDLVLRQAEFRDRAGSFG